MSQHGWNVPVDPQAPQQPSQFDSRTSLPYGLTPAAVPPPYSAQPSLNAQPSFNSYNYPSMNTGAPYTPPLSPPPPYNPLYNANEYPMQQQNYFSYNQSQSPSQPFQPNYPYYQQYPPQNFGQQESLPAGEEKASFGFSDGSIPSSPQSSSSRESINRAPSIGFDGNASIRSTNGIYPNLSNTISNDANANNISQDIVRTPLPPNLAVLWDGAKSAKLFFVQHDGYVVSPNKDINFTAYRCPPMTDVSSYPVGSLAGNARNATVLLEALDVWRLGLSKERSYIVRGYQGEFAFYDDSTSPARCVVVMFPKGITKEERQRLDVLLTGSSFLVNEPANFVDKIESGVGSVFDTLTQSVDNVVKKQTPDIHKSTKWLRKGTGQVVRFGGSLVSRGVHLVSDTVIDKDTPKEATAQHKDIFKALKVYRDAVEKRKVTRVNSL